MSLVHNAGLTTESSLSLSQRDREERRRCFWSVFLLNRLHGADFSVIAFSAEENFPLYPESAEKPPNLDQSLGQPTRSTVSGSTHDATYDKGVVACAIQLSEIWHKITRYARRRGKPSSLPPWSPQSEYQTILAKQMDFEAQSSYTHRFKPAGFSNKSSAELYANRDYWGPWLFTQFIYHTNLCLLNHPLLLSLRLRNLKCQLPEIFLQHISDMIASHASWIVLFIDLVESKSFKVSDPFLGHCAAIVATIYLQESFVDDATTRRDKQGNFNKCLEFIRALGEQWPHVAQLV